MSPVSDNSREESALGSSRSITFTASVVLTAAEIEKAGGDILQAIQNEVGFAGVKGHLGRHRLMPDADRIQRGLDYEETVAKAVGGSTVGGSGSSWRSKSDVRGKFRISAKAEATKSWRRLVTQLYEAIDFARGTGEVPALAVLDDDGGSYIILRLEDFSRALAEDIKITPATSRGDTVRATAETPALLRGT